MTGSKARLLRARMALASAEPVRSSVMRYGGFAASARDSSAAGAMSLMRGFQIARGKLVFRVVAGDGDENLRRQIRCLAEIRLARRGQKRIGVCAAEEAAKHSKTRNAAAGADDLADGVNLCNCGRLESKGNKR